MVVVGDVYGADLLEGVGVEEAKGCGAIGHYEIGGVVGEAPALACIGEGSQQLEGVFIEYEGLACVEGELVDFVIENRDSFAEKFVWLFSLF